MQDNSTRQSIIAGDTGGENNNNNSNLNGFGNNSMNDNLGASKRSRSQVPGSISADQNSHFGASSVFKWISENETKKLSLFLNQQGGHVNVVTMKESRYYSTLTFAAFKNHLNCFLILYQHGIKYNLPLGLDMKP